MSRWTIEKDGTGIEKSGTGIERSGTGIERSGTGIEKSGTGIERSGTGIGKSGTGIRRFLFACTIAGVAFSSGLQAGDQDPAGSLQLVVNRNTVAVSWIIEGSVFSGVGSLSGSYSELLLTEIALTGEGSDSTALVTGGGTGSNTMVTGGGTGSAVRVTGGGTGSAVQVTGGGTGSAVRVTGGGTGSAVQVTGGGTGSAVQVTGGGTGSAVQVTGGGTGTEAITITLPDGTGMAMEVEMGCKTASVTVLDSAFRPIVAFSNVPVIGDTGLCSSGFDAGFKANPGGDFRVK